MLVISLCWWPYDGDWFQMLVAKSLCWRHFPLCWWFFNGLNRSPTSWIGHQHLKLATNTFDLQHPSPTSMYPIKILECWNRIWFLQFLFLHFSASLHSFWRFYNPDVILNPDIWNLIGSNFLSNFYRIFTGLLDIGSFVDLDSCFLFPFEPVLEFFFCAATIDNSKIIPTKTKIK